MPGMGGMETLQAMKADPVLRTMPVIVLSTSAEPPAIRSAYEWQANAYVQKPGELNALDDFVQAVGNFWQRFVILPAKDRRAAL